MNQYPLYFSQQFIDSTSNTDSDTEETDENLFPV